MQKIILSFFLIHICYFAIAQDTLPNFSAIKKKDGTAFLTWVNDYGIVKQITIQRSTDSLRRFASIGTFPNAMAKKGMFIDAKTKLVDHYYRIFIQLPEGNYFYTPAQKVKRFDDISNTIIIDSSIINQDTSLKNKPIVFVPSDYIFTDKKGNVIITLPNAETRFYKVVFLDANNKPFLTIPRVKESNLIMEKYNFYKSGWYYFEIYLEGKLMEKHQFQIPKETKALNK